MKGPFFMICKNPEIIQWARQVQEIPALVIDTEASGGSFWDEIIDIAVIEAGTGRILFNSLIKPTTPLNYYASKIHKISEKDLIKAPKFTDIYQELSFVLDNRTILAYNASFDQRLLRQSYQKYFLDPPHSSFECLMNAYEKYRGYKYSTLTNACLEMSAKPGSHRALTDALAAGRLLYRMTQGF